LADPADLGFGGRGLVFSTTQSLVQWESLLGRYRSQRSDPGWLQMIAATLASPDPVRTANRLVNTAIFVEEGGDAWTTPYELLQSGGDCEDFAIAKYLLLREIGIPSSDLLLVAERGPDHMVLLVHTENHQWLVLDSRTGLLLRYRDAGRRVAYAFNGDGVWLVIR
jgi:hypothetical protein